TRQRFREPRDFAHAATRRAVEGTRTRGHPRVSRHAENSTEGWRDGSSEKTQPIRVVVKKRFFSIGLVALLKSFLSQADGADALKLDSDGYIRNWVMLAPIALPEAESGAE